MHGHIRKDIPDLRSSEKREWENDSKKPRPADCPVIVVICAFFTEPWGCAAMHCPTLFLTSVLCWIIAAILIPKLTLCPAKF